MEPRVSLITLGVADLDRARRFYEALGWKDESTDADVVFFQCGGMIVGLWDRAALAKDSHAQDAGGWGGVTLAYNVRVSREVDVVVAEIAAAGGTVLVLLRRRSGAAVPPSSPIRTDTAGRSPTTPTGTSRTAGGPGCLRRRPVDATTARASGTVTEFAATR